MTASPLARHQVFLRKEKAASSPFCGSGFHAASAGGASLAVMAHISARWHGEKTSHSDMLQRPDKAQGTSF